MIDPIPECWPAHICLSALWQWIENWQTDKLVRAEPNYLCPDLTLCVWPSMDNSDNGDIWRDITFAVALLRFKRLHFLQQIFLQLMMLVDKGSDVSRLPEMMMLLLHPQLGEEKRIQKRKKHQNKRENASPNWVNKREEQTIASCSGICTLHFAIFHRCKRNEKEWQYSDIITPLSALDSCGICPISNYYLGYSFSNHVFCFELVQMSFVLDGSIRPINPGYSPFQKIDQLPESES